MNDKIEIPFYGFFEDLRSQKIVLGTDEYLALLEVLMYQVQEKSLDYFEKEAMYRLCKLLWLKPQQNELEFKALFDKYWKIMVFKREDFLENPIKKDTSENETKPSTHETELPEKNKDSKKEKQPLNTGGDKNNDSESQQVFINISEAENQEQRVTEIAPRHFYFQENYVPFLKRNIGQAWRFLQKNNYIGISQEIDIAKTIAYLSKTGVLQKVIFKQLESNAMQMLTLIEHRGGMIAFKNIALELAKSAKISAGIDNKIFFFQKVPHIIDTPEKKGYCIYSKEDETEFDTIEHVLGKMKKNTPVLIISDAGAVANYFDSERVQKTKHFLDKLKTYTQKIVWLNPMPKDRRQENSAQIIEQYITTFEANPDGLKKAIKILKGKKTV